MDRTVRLALVFLLAIGTALWTSQACNQNGPTIPDPVAQPTLDPNAVKVGPVTVVEPTATRPVATVPNLTAFIDKMDEACYVTNKTGQTQNIRFRVYQVNDLSDPANVATQTLLFDRTTPVPNASVDYMLRHNLVLCKKLYQFDCGRGEGLLAYAFKWGVDPCPVPTPTPNPTPTPTPTPNPTPTPSPTPSPTPTPDPGICHVSNKGCKDEQVNLVLSHKNSGTGHELHLDPTKFCPPDHVGACSCEKAVADAIACGVPVPPKGFECKIEGGE